MPTLNGALLYTLGAVLATALNVCSQWLCFQYVGSDRLILGMALGTGAGLIFKYGFDKMLVFEDRSLRFRRNAQSFWRYTLSGAFTTALFWATELTFSLFSHQEEVRYLGAVLGLTLGYSIKYYIDRRFVFWRHSHES